MNATRTSLLAVAGAFLVASGCRSPRPVGRPAGLDDTDRVRAQALAHVAQGLLHEGCLEPDLEAALSSFRQAVSASPDDPELWLQVARLLLELGRPEEADEVLHEAGRRLPASPALHLARGRLASWRALHGQAAESFARAGEAADQPAIRAEAWAMEALARFHHDDDQAARAALGRLAALPDSPAEPDGPRAEALRLALDLAITLVRNGDLDRADRFVRWAVARAPTRARRADLWHLYGIAARRPGLPRAAAREALLAAAREDPLRFDAVLMAFDDSTHGTASGDLPDDRPGAAELAVLAHAQDHPDPALLVAAAMIHSRRNRHDAALRSLREALDAMRADPEFADAVPPPYKLLLGELLAKTGDTRGAEAALRDLLRRHPGHPAAQNNLAYLLAEEGRDLEEAKQLVRQALEAEPENPAFLDTLGWILFQRGAFEDALRWLAMAATAAPDSAVIQDHLGDALAQLGRLREAVVHWSISLHLDAANSAVAEKLARHGVDVAPGAAAPRAADAP